MPLDRHPHRSRLDLFRNPGGADVLGHPFRIFGVVIVETGLGLELGDGQSLVAEHGHGQLPAADEGLGQQPLEMPPRPFALAPDRIAVITALGDDRDPHGRAFVDGL